MDARISVIIPTLNEEHYLPKLLEDLAQQTECDFEVLIIDGGSTDKTHERTLSYSKKLSLHFITAPKAHLAFQRNLGAQKAKTDYFFFIDADTRIEKDIIEKLYQHIREEKGLLYLPYIKPSNPTFTNKFLVRLTILSVKLLQNIHKPLSIGPMIVISKKLFEEIGGFSEITSASEDHNLVIKAYKKGVKAQILDDAVCYFSMRRFDQQGAWRIVWQYGLFTLETIIKNGVYKKSVNYEMGGQKYKK